MYIYVDRPVEDLNMGGRFLLWAMRGWSRAIAAGTCPPVALSRGFASVGALTALPDFHLAMALFNRDALERISVAPMDCARILEDEAVLLGMWRDLALGDVDHMRATLALMTEEDTVSPIAQAMTAVMAKLIAAGFDLSGLVRETIEEEK